MIDTGNDARQSHEGAENMADQKTVFQRTSRQPKNELRGQAAVILNHLSENKDKAFTIESLTDATKSNIVTRQDPERVVAYYLSIFKKRGLVVATRPEPVIEDESGTEDEDESEDVDEMEEVAE
jgi:hypothetical protein